MGQEGKILEVYKNGRLPRDIQKAGLCGVKRSQPGSYNNARILRSQIINNDIQLLAELKIAGDKQQFYIKCPKALLDKYAPGQSVSREDLTQVQALLIGKKNWQNLKEISKEEMSNKSKVPSDLALFHLMIEDTARNLLDDYMNEHHLQSLHQAQKYSLN